MPDIQSRLKPGDTTERCGLVLKGGKVVELENVHPEPAKGFAIRAADMHRYRKSMVGAWHTHPGQSAALSHADYEGFSQWPGLTHYIVGVDGVRAYRVDDDGIVLPCN